MPEGAKCNYGTFCSCFSCMRKGTKHKIGQLPTNNQYTHVLTRTFLKGNMLHLIYLDHPKTFLCRVSDSLIHKLCQTFKCDFVKNKKMLFGTSGINPSIYAYTSWVLLFCRLAEETWISQWTIFKCCELKNETTREDFEVLDFCSCAYCCKCYYL